MAKQETPLRLLVVGLSWPPETFLARLLHGLADRGVQVTLAGARRPTGDWLGRAGRGWLPLPRRGAAVALRWAPLAGRRWDVIYFPWNAAAVDYLPLFDLGYPVVVSCRGAQINVAPHNPQRTALRDGLRATLTRAAAVHCVSDAIRREAAQYGLEPRKAWVIRPAVDPALFCPPPAAVDRPGGALRLVTTGSLIWRKGYEYLLAALRILRDRGCAARLAIIGDGPERQRTLYSIHDLGLTEAVTLHGRLPPAQVVAQLQQADVFVLASLSEGISNAALEGMACGLAVVSSDCGGMREAVLDGVTGLLVPPRDPTALAGALARLAEAPAQRRRMGAAGRARVLAHFDLADQAAQFHALLRAVRIGI
jgi:colanic acid/amylovoran biosynthesis glycosyltransferase